MNLRHTLIVPAALAALLALNGCNKNESRTGKSLYELNKPKFDQLDEEVKNAATTFALFPNTPSWTSGTEPIPSAITFYYCGNTASPLGGSYVRFHYQVDFDNTTKKALRFDKRLELRFFSGTFGTSGDDSKVYLTTATTWPVCVYVDRPASELAIPNYMVAALVSPTGVSTYHLTATGPYGQPGWNGIVDFSTPPTYSISKGNYILPHPDGYGVACP